MENNINCNHCGCMPKPDEWSSETLCIDCATSEEI